MRKLIFQINITLDGFILGPEKSLDWMTWNDEMADYLNEAINHRIDLILLGRRLAEEFLAYWPAAVNDQSLPPGEIEFAKVINSLPKIVFSTSLEKASWPNVRLIHDNLAHEIQALKHLPGKDMILYGGAGITQSMMKLGLIDEFHLFVHPVIVGAGLPLFQNLAERIQLKITKTRTFSNGVALLLFQPR